MDLNNRRPKDLEDFSAMANQLAREFWAVTAGRNLHSGVLLAALIDVHQSVVHALSDEGQQSAATALQSYSNDLQAHCELTADISTSTASFIASVH